MVAGAAAGGRRAGGGFLLLLVAGLIHVLAHTVAADVVVFFNSSQVATPVASGTTSDTISSEGYLFTCSRDKLFTGGVGLTNPIGRTLRVQWPAGLEAQAVTAGPVLSKARMAIRRVDGQPFDVTSFTARLLANTAGAGAAIEVMPKWNGEDARNDPFMYQATGYYGQNFFYATPELSGYDEYVIGLYVDFAVLNLTALDAGLPPPLPPVLEMIPLGAGMAQLSWPTANTNFVLQQKSAFNSAGWITAAEPVSIVGENYHATISLTNGARFFRLRSNP